MLKVRQEKLTYTVVPKDNKAYTDKMDKIYTRYAKAYDGFIALFPLWKRWLSSVLPQVKGESLLDISFGPGYLFRRYPKNMALFGLDYNAEMVKRARKKTKRRGIAVDITKGNVEHMPYADKSFDTVVNTMAFSGYPDGEKAMAEMLRVLSDDGVLLILDYDYPKNRNWFGYLVVKLIEKCGDITKDIGAILDKHRCIYQRKVVSGFGSIQLFIIQKQQ